MDKKSIGDMTESELDAELLENGVDPVEITRRAFNKAFSHLRAASLRIAELERQLAEARKVAEWVPIDEEHLPKVGDEVGGYDPPLAIPFVISVASLADLDIHQWRCMGYTHYRPGNAPQGKESHD
jgi:hypothetical protein